MSTFCFLVPASLTSALCSTFTSREKGIGSNKAAELSDKEQNRRNKTMKKKKQQQVTEKDEQQNEVEERRNTTTVMKKKKRRRAEEKYAVKNSSEDDTLEAKTGKKRDNSSRKKKRRSEDKSVGKSDQLGDDVGDGFQEENGVGAAEQNESETQGNTDSSKDAGKLEKSGKNRKSLISSKKGKKSSEKRKGPQTDISFVKDEEVEADDVYHISSGDDDCSKGMKEWLVEYQQSRPRLKILQEKIDEFITAHEAQLEQERKEREARAAEGGWTVVVHHKGRKKTTDSESGITVGSVAQAVVEDKMTKKKNKEVGLDFYRFQKREAQRNEIMMLQSKFEQDKKRIQQLRAARKFRPY